MIKIKLSDNQNMKCFSGLILSKDILRDYSIELTESNDYDYEFISANEFIKSSLDNNCFLNINLASDSIKTSYAPIIEVESPP